MKKEEENSESELEKEIEQSELEENLEDISREAEDEMEEDIDSETFERFVGNWSMESVSPSLERVASPISSASESSSFTREIEEIDENRRNAALRETRIYSTPQKNYDVIAEEEFRRYEIEQTGINAPTLSTAEIDFSPRMINPFLDKNIIREDIEPASFEVRRTETKKKLPFERDEKYRR